MNHHPIRTLQPVALQHLHHTGPDGSLHQHLQSLSPGLQSLDGIPTDPNEVLFQQRYLGDASQTPHPHVHTHTHTHPLHAPNPFDHNAGLPPTQTQYQGIPAGYAIPPARFNLIASQPQHIQTHAPPPLQQPLTQVSPSLVQQQRLPGLEPQSGFIQTQDIEEGPATTNHGQFEGLKLIPNPPNLDEWRMKLFDADDTITLTEDEFQTYFPHIDNVYSHRSTQKHKRKRFVSHYWDCRLKGRPPGTKKSTDPDKKKRKRVARERDLCDVKIKITEYFDGEEFTDQTGQQPPPDTHTVTNMNNAMDTNSLFTQTTHVSPQQSVNPWGMQTMAPPAMQIPQTQAQQQMEKPKKYYTIQRVNGNGGNGKPDGAAGPHRHSLEESDRVKKNSVIRWMAKNEKDKRKEQGGETSKKTYHKKATGLALATVKAHSKDDDLKLYGSCFCPFVQRVWISLEAKAIPYQYIEVDPYKKPQSLLDVNPRGLVPAIRHGPTWSTHESTVIMEYLEDLGTGPPLFPSDPQTKATSRLWTDHINRNIIPSFYRLLQAQDPNDQVTHATELRNEISKIVDVADHEGPFFLGRGMTFVDVQMAPWVIRLRRVLGPYRGWPEPEQGSRWAKWVHAIENEKSVKTTTSDDGLYLDSYERYAENRPNTSQLANAVNSGRGLP